MGILGIDIGGTNIRVGLVEGERVCKIETSLINKNHNKDEIIEDVISLVKKFDIDKIEGIGVGVPAVVDVEKGIVYDVQNIPCWKKIYLKNIMESEFRIPVYVNNDANCFAVGVKFFGEAKKYRSVVGLIIGTGLGAGIIINNKLYSGKNCGAGEFGRIPFKDSELEDYCCGRYFRNIYGIDGETISKKANKGDRRALSILNEFGKNIGEAIKIVMYTLDPEAIILGGSVSKSYGLFKESMWNTISNFAYTNSKVVIKPSRKKHIALLGAAALFCEAKQVNK